MISAEAREREARIAGLPLLSTAPPSGAVRGTLSSVREIWGRRDLLGLLVRRELRARYKDSSLGFVWSLVRPIAQLLVYYFAIGQIMQLAKGIPGFAVFVFTGLTVWTVFTEIVNGGTTSIVSNAGLVKKVYLPREIFPLAAVGGGIFTLGIQVVVLLIATVLLQQFPLSPQLLWAIPSLALIVVFGAAVAILLSALNVYLRDVQHLVEVGLIILFWGSPIVYSYRFVQDSLAGSWLLDVYLANPVTIAVLGAQRAFWAAGQNLPDQFPPGLGLRMLVCGLVSLVLLWIAQRVFARLQGDFAQEL